MFATLKTLITAVIVIVTTCVNVVVAGDDFEVPAKREVRTAQGQAAHLADLKAKCEVDGKVFEIRVVPRKDNGKDVLDYFKQCAPKK